MTGRAMPARNRLVTLVAVFLVAGVGPSGCLINPKDYPLASDSPDVAGAGGEDMIAGGGATNRGGTASTAGQSGQSVGGGSAGYGGKGSADGGSSGSGGSDRAGSPGAQSEGGAGGDNGLGGVEAGTTGGTSGAGIVGGGAGSSSRGGAGSTVKRVFVSSSTSTGDFKAFGDTTDGNGLNGANAFCAQAAADAGLGGRWVAWLSVTGNDALNRIVDVAPWYLVDETTRVFDTHAQLASQANVPVNMDENGDTVSGRAWTGTTLLGTAHSARCDEWKNDGTQLGAWGDIGNAFDWSYKNTDWCSTTAHLYCFEQ